MKIGWKRFKCEKLSKNFFFLEIKSPIIENSIEGDYMAMAQSKLADEIHHLEMESKIINKKAREHYLEQVSDFKEKIKQISDEAGTKAKQVVDRVGEYINENPQKATLIGVGVGLGLGVLLGVLLKKGKQE